MKSKFIFASLAAALALWLPNFAHPWVEAQDPRGNTLGFHKDGTHPSGLVDTWAYDAEGRQTRACQAGLCTQTQYDSLGRAIQTTDAAGHTSATAYDAAGQVTSATDALGHQTTYQYDLAGRQTQSTDPLGRSTHYRYDAAGNLTEETNPLGQITRHSYNAAHQKTATTGPSGAATQYQYSPTGQRTAQTSPEGNTTRYSYDSLGRLSQVTDAQGNTTGYQYNSQGQLLAQTDAEGKTTQYGYDRAGRRVQRTLADGANEALHYNALGQLTQKTHFDGSQTTWEYGAAASGNIPNPAWGQITREHRADGSSQSRSYDSHGRHIQTSDSRDGTETRDLDLLGRVTQQSTTHSAAQLSGSSAYQSRQNYQWDANSRRTQLHTPASGSNPEYRIHSSWDAAGQLQSLQASSDTSPNQFTHDAAGRLTQITRSDGSSTSYQYTPDGHISQIRHQGSQGQTLAQFDYQHNRDGQRTQAVEVIHAAGSTAPTTQRTINWTYDSAGKLTSEQITQTQPTAQTLTIAYQYDKVGNRTARTVSGAIQQTTTYQYDQNDRLTQSSDSIEGTTSYRYDRKGNLVEKANGNNKTAYSWNSDNRLIKVEHTGQNNKTIQYGYDPQGRRIKKLVTQGTSKTETHYSLDSERPYHEVTVESTRVNTQPWTHKTYVHTPGGVGELISQSDGATTKQIYADAQGTTRLIADGATGASQSYSFDAFGNWLEGDSLAANQNPPTHLYTGERYDADTGLIYLRARDYDPATGRFISMDEHPGDQRIPLTLNKYLYANADPVNHVDPSGNMFISIAMPNFGHMVRITSAGRQTLGLLEKLDNALLMMQMIQAYNSVWSVLNGPEWQQGNDAAKNDLGFLHALSNFDEAMLHLASRSGRIFSHANVKSGVKEFLKGQAAKNKSHILIYAPTPMVDIDFPVKHIKIGNISLSRLSADIYLEIGKRKKQGGRMIGVGHTWKSPNGSKQWFRQDWHPTHDAGDICFQELGADYHYHCPR
ncbi:RHS repeat protein [Vandammella animalimorsus]|uniref:RHS repeat protein n=1 Tax=Vandammella animalimorsus TaxID=2029117 RepID=UPI0015527BA7|nr:RHS repeat protein [Vandammella animalimorsus]